MQETLDRLRLELAELRASRRRLVLAADADRRRIERELHDGLQQDLVALAVNLQLAAGLVEVDPAAVKRLLDEMRRDVQEAVDEAARLAERIYPPLLDPGSLGAALRSAAARAGRPVSVEVTDTAVPTAERAAALYSCCLDALAHVRPGTRASVVVSGDAEAISFEVGGDGDGSDERLEHLRDRVEALGGRLTVAAGPGGAIRISGSLPS